VLVRDALARQTFANLLQRCELLRGQIFFAHISHYFLHQAILIRAGRASARARPVVSSVSLVVDWPARLDGAAFTSARIFLIRQSDCRSADIGAEHSN